MKIIRLQLENVSLSDAIEIVRNRMDDDTISMKTKILAIEAVAEMETHNSLRKADFIIALRWIFSHYDLVGVL